MYNLKKRWVFREIKKAFVAMAYENPVARTLY